MVMERQNVQVVVTSYLLWTNSKSNTIVRIRRHHWMSMGGARPYMTVSKQKLCGYSMLLVTGDKVIKVLVFITHFLNDHEVFSKSCVAWINLLRYFDTRYQPFEFHIFFTVISNAIVCKLLLVCSTAAIFKDARKSGAVQLLLLFFLFNWIGSFIVTL